MSLLQVVGPIIEFAGARECSWTERDCSPQIQLVGSLCQTSRALNDFVLRNLRTWLRIPRWSPLVLAPTIRRVVQGWRLPLYIQRFTFCGDHSESEPVTIDALMTETSFSGKHLRASGAIMLAAFLPKCQ